MNTVAQLVAVLAAITAALKKLVRKLEHHKHEEAVNAVQDEPADWFTDHFNGVRDLPDTAGETGEAPPAQHDSNS